MMQLKSLQDKWKKKKKRVGFASVIYSSSLREKKKAAITNVGYKKKTTQWNAQLVLQVFPKLSFLTFPHPSVCVWKEGRGPFGKRNPHVHFQGPGRSELSSPSNQRASFRPTHHHHHLHPLSIQPPTAAHCGEMSPHKISHQAGRAEGGKGGGTGGGGEKGGRTIFPLAKLLNK